jgi:hypothetical protein
MKRVLIACEYSGSVRDEFLKLGFDAYSCDLLPCESKYDSSPDRHHQGDILEVLKSRLGFDDCSSTLYPFSSKWGKVVYPRKKTLVFAD